jgi:hypothetical protein
VVASWGSGAGRGAVRASLTRDLKFRIVQHGPAPLLRLSARLQKKNNWQMFSKNSRTSRLQIDLRRRERIEKSPHVADRTCGWRWAQDGAVHSTHTTEGDVVDGPHPGMNAGFYGLDRVTFSPSKFRTSLDNP